MFDSFSCLKVIQLTLLATLLLSFSSFNEAEADGFGKWIKERTTKITKSVSNAVDKAVKETINGNGNETTQNKNTQLSRREVAELQSRLNSLGYSVGAADGVAGPKTYSAISTYEQEQGLPVTGIPSASVLSSLRQHSVYTANNTDHAPISPNNSSSGGGLLKPTATTKGVPATKDVANIQLINNVDLPLETVVPGDDFFNPIVMPMLNGLPIISQVDELDGLKHNEKLFLLLLGEEYPHLHQGSTHRNKWLELLIAVRKEHRKNYGSCHSRFHNKTNDLMFGSAECKLHYENEFEQKRIVDKFNSEVKSKFLSRSLKLPTKYYWGGFVTLDKYDFDRQKIRLGTHNGTLKYKYYHQSSSIPKEMSMSPEVGEQLLNKAHKLYWLIKFTSDGHQPIGGVDFYTTDRYETRFKTVPLLK